VRRRGDYVRKLLHEGVNKPKQGTDVGDHPPMYVCLAQASQAFQAR
jgi:hypothetical protein